MIINSNGVNIEDEKTSQEIANINSSLADLAGAIKMEIGSYQGTGTFGLENPTIINCSFKPKIVLITFMKPDWDYWATGSYGVNSSYAHSPILLDLRDPEGVYVGYRFSTSRSIYIKTAGNSVHIYEEKSPAWQFNNSGWTYRYIALG